MEIWNAVSLSRASIGVEEKLRSTSPGFTGDELNNLFGNSHSVFERYINGTRDFRYLFRLISIPTLKRLRRFGRIP